MHSLDLKQILCLNSMAINIFHEYVFLESIELFLSREVPGCNADCQVVGIIHTCMHVLIRK